MRRSVAAQLPSIAASLGTPTVTTSVTPVSIGKEAYSSYTRILRYRRKKELWRTIYDLPWSALARHMRAAKLGST